MKMCFLIGIELFGLEETLKSASSTTPFIVSNIY